MTNQPTFTTIASDEEICIHTTTFCAFAPALEVHAHIFAPIPNAN